MKFKLTKLKLVVSIIAALIANLVGLVFLAGCVGFFRCYFFALADAWFIWLAVLIIVYIIWSLIEK